VLAVIAALGVRPSTAAARNQFFRRRVKPVIASAFHVAATVGGRSPGPFSRKGLAAVSRYTRLLRASVKGMVKKLKNDKNAYKCQFSLFKLSCFLMFCSGKFASYLASHQSSLPENRLLSKSLKSEN